MGRGGGGQNRFDLISSFWEAWVDLCQADMQRWHLRGLVKGSEPFGDDLKPMMFVIVQSLSKLRSCDSKKTKRCASRMSV